MRQNLNEYSILFHLLTQQKFESSSPNKLFIGARVEEIKEKLKMTGKYSQDQFHEIMAQFSQNIHPFGLVVRQNPFNQFWYLTQNQDIQSFFKSNPFQNKPRLAATFATILSLCLITSGSTDISALRKIRQKKDVQSDIDELVHLQLIEQSGNRINMHVNIGYYLDIELFSKYMEKEAHKSMNFENEENLNE